MSLLGSFCRSLFILGWAISTSLVPLAAAPAADQTPPPADTLGPTKTGVRYVNPRYGFAIDLPESWRGFTVLERLWKSTSEGEAASGPAITLRHPLWKTDAPREDMPIMVFTRDQWKKVESEELRVSAAPIPPSELGHNSKFVIALPPRYDYDYLEGFEEVDALVHDLSTFEP